jgi:hypothetical protein
VSASPHARIVGGETRMPSFWLPPDALGNGLAAASWAAIADVEPARADLLLQSLAASGVPACTAPLHGRFAAGLYRVYVDPAHYARAENVLLSEMARPLPPQPRDEVADESAARSWWRRRPEWLRGGRAGEQAE